MEIMVIKKELLGFLKENHAYQTAFVAETMLERDRRVDNIYLILKNNNKSF